MRRVLRLPGGVEATVQVDGAATDGTFTMLADRAPAGWSLPPHRHDVGETIHITAGRSWITIDGERHELGPGDTVHVPAGALHTGGTSGEETLERVVVFAPAGMETFFRALDGVDDPAAALGLALEHGWRFD